MTCFAKFHGLDFSSSRLRSLFSKYQTQLRQDLEKLLVDNADFQVKRYQTTSTKDTIFKKKIERLYDEVIYCLQPAIRSEITVFNLQSDEDLSEVIFRTVAQCK